MGMKQDAFFPQLGRQFPSLEKSVQSMNAASEFAKRVTESPAMKAMNEMNESSRKLMDKLENYLESPRGRIETSLHRKGNGDNNLVSFANKIVDVLYRIETKGEQLSTLILGIFRALLLAMVFVVAPPSESGNFPTPTRVRARLMALRGLALSCAPNSSWKSDKFIHQSRHSGNRIIR